MVTSGDGVPEGAEQFGALTTFNHVVCELTDVQVVGNERVDIRLFHRLRAWRELLGIAPAGRPLRAIAQSARRIRSGAGVFHSVRLDTSSNPAEISSGNSNSTPVLTAS